MTNIFILINIFRNYQKITTRHFLLQTWLLQQFIYWLTKVKHLLKLQKACTGFVLNKYGTCEDITKLKWLQVPERINFTIAKLIFKSLLKENVPENLKIQIRTSNRSLRTPNKVILEYTNLQTHNHFTSITRTR